ncbi:uncharacterized protein G2W53_000507 [Senna tora]|uniref:Uncharacterized protein n=1 Tax=Senna tora TaxID=362788 RepID=A0A835CLP2_9FABA|nr:uncharacterized protein G2W53_000507 [Senna tora]
MCVGSSVSTREEGERTVSSVTCSKICFSSARSVLQEIELKRELREERYESEENEESVGRRRRQGKEKVFKRAF